MKSFLRPVIGVVGILAIGAAATLVGMRFASPEVTTAPGSTVEAPILTPIAAGVDEPPADLVSEEAGSLEVTSLGTAPVALPAELESVITAVEESDDPAFTIAVYTDEEESGAADDACAPRAGVPADDCPEGLRSTILALDGVRELYIGGVAFPDIRDQHLDEGPYSLYPWCDAVEHAETEVPFGILSTAPANMVVSYWPSDDPENVRTQFVSTSDADRAAYDAAAVAGTDMLEMPLARHCVVLTGLEPDAAYTATIRAVDIFDRTADGRQVWFNSGGRLGVPGPEISTLGDNIVFAHALHTADERVVIRGILAGDEAPTCDAAPTPSAIIHESETTVSGDYLLARGVLPEYTQRTNATFIVPEGSTFVVCVRVYPAGEGVPSWEAGFPDLETRIPILVPDFVRPTVTVQRLEIQRETQVRMGSGTVEGIPCGDTLDTSRATLSHLPFVLCDGARISPTIVLADELRNYGYRGDLVMKSSITPQGGTEFVRDSVLSLGQHRCDPGCPTPDRLFYRATLGAPGTEEHAVISVTWDQGRTNGAGDWVIPPIETTSPEYVRPAIPDFNRDAPRDNFSINWVQKNVSLAYELTVDRPVDYTVSVLSDGPDPALPCYDEAAVTSLSGHADSSVDLNFAGLCLGAAYALNVELIDADGTAVRYGTKWSDTDYLLLPITTPGWDGDLVWDITMNGPRDARVTAASFRVNGTQLLPEGAYDQCTTTSTLHYSGTTTVSLAQENLVTARAEWYTTPTTGTGCRSVSMAHRSSVWQTVTIDEVQWGAEEQGVWVSASDGFGTRIHLWMDDLR